MNIKQIIREVQRIEGLDVDGIAGDDTWGRIAKKYRIGATPAPDPRDPLDPRSAMNIATLLPNVQPAARTFLINLNNRLPHRRAKIIQGHRTYEEQNELYEIGRTKPPFGKIVTKARGGYSNHNFGIAFDIGIFDEHGNYIDDGPEYDVAGELGKRAGLEWGGDWSGFIDRPHFQWRPNWSLGMNSNDMLAELRRRKANGEAYV